MADSLGVHHRSTTWSQVDNIRRPSLETVLGSSNIPSNRLATNGTTSSSSLDRDPHEKPLFSPGLSKSRRTLRQSRSMIGELKAYPLPNPSQFENNTAAAAPPSSSSSSSSSSTAAEDPSNDILFPVQSFRRERERESKLRQVAVTSPRESPSPSSTATAMGGKLQPSNIRAGKKQLAPPDDYPDGDKAPAPKSNNSLANSLEPALGTLQETEEEVQIASTGSSSSQGASSQCKVVVVCDAERKFTTAAVDVALREFATTEGDAIVVVAFLEHIMSPMGMKLGVGLHEFSGVNESTLRQTILLKTRDIESKLSDTNRLQQCRTKKIQLDVKVLPGSNPKALIAKAILDFQATCAIFDKNAMSNRKYYEKNLACRILRLRGDGRRVERISLLGDNPKPTAHSSDSSSDSSMTSSELSTHSPSMWSKLKLFGSKRSSGSSLRHSYGGAGSILGSSSSTSSNLESPRRSVQEGDEPGVSEQAELLAESFSFDSPKPNPAEAFIYAAAGLDKFGSRTRARNGESHSLPTALAA